MNDKCKIALIGALSFLATAFSFVKYAALPVMVVLMVMKFSGEISMSWGMVLFVPWGVFIVCVLLQASCIVASKELLK